MPHHLAMAPPLPGTLGNPTPGGAPTNSPLITQASTRRRVNSRDEQVSNGMFGGSGQQGPGVGGANGQGRVASSLHLDAPNPGAVVGLPAASSGSEVSWKTQHLPNMMPQQSLLFPQAV